MPLPLFHPAHWPTQVRMGGSSDVQSVKAANTSSGSAPSGSLSVRVVTSPWCQAAKPEHAMVPGRRADLAPWRGLRCDGRQRPADHYCVGDRRGRRERERVPGIGDGYHPQVRRG